MGEVYRARDTRLGRDVAIKVLPDVLLAGRRPPAPLRAGGPAAGVLNHPNITAVYDIGSHDGAPYVVSELLEGETLRPALAAGSALGPQGDRLRPPDRAWARRRARERDRPPGPEAREPLRDEDGRVKILDFGLAKLTQPTSGGQATNLPTATAGTEPGVVLGTLGYMSPEQVRG